MGQVTEVTVAVGDTRIHFVKDLPVLKNLQGNLGLRADASLARPPIVPVRAVDIVTQERLQSRK
jgi:hypothetical protein